MWSGFRSPYARLPHTRPTRLRRHRRPSGCEFPRAPGTQPQNTASARAPADRAVLAPPRLLVRHLSSAQDVLQRVGHRLRQWRLAARRLGRQELRLRVPGRQRRRRPLALQAGHLWLGGRAQGGAAGLELRIEEASYAGGCVSRLGARAGSASQDGLVC